MIRSYLLEPIRAFLNIQSFSGILLFGVTIIALIWANSPYADIYTEIFNYKLGIETSNFKLVKPLVLWINDGLMAVFFFLIGLEIKREVTMGELNTLRKATFPFFAAIGGMMVPALIYVALVDDPAISNGWAIPMATDIAFTLAILKLLGDRIPLSLKVFLTAFAIVDDLGAIMIIAMFYSGGIKWFLLSVALVLIVLLALLGRFGVYNKYLMVLVAIVSWYFFLKAGVHPTLAGVLVAFTVPIQRRSDTTAFVTELKQIAHDFEEEEDEDTSLLTYEQVDQLDLLESWIEKIQSPLQTMEHSLHGWVAYVIMPIFALANAGVNVTSGVELHIGLVSAIVIALVIGNSIGISAMTTLAIKSGASSLPSGVKPLQVLGIAFLAGVGFTMSVFIANLAFADNQQLLDSAKIGVLIGSVLSGMIAVAVLFFNSRTDTITESS